MRVQHNRVSTYFIQAEDGGPIKIGKIVFTDVDLRLRQLQTGNPSVLVVRRVVDGDREAEMHQRYGDLRIRGEWFFPAPRLATYAGALPYELPEDAAALNQAHADGFRTGWAAAIKEFAEDFALRVAEEIKPLAVRSGYAALATATNRLEWSLESATSRPQEIEENA